MSTLTFNYKKPHICISDVIFIRSIKDRIKMAWNVLCGSYYSTTFYSFENEKDANDGIGVLSHIYPKEEIKVEKVFPEAILPTKAHDSDVGWDLYSPIDFKLNPGEARRIDFGIRVEIPDGYYIYVHNRSGLVWKYNTMMTLGTGVVDTGYRGSILAPFHNFGTEQMQYRRGYRLAQMVIRKVEDMKLVEGKVNTNTDRGDGGFGSTGR